MPASAALLNLLAGDDATYFVWVGLVDAGGVELTGGGYARQATTATATGANVRLDTDETFSIPAGAVVAGWRAYSASVAGTDYGGSALTQETYVGAGTYVLLGASTGHNLTAV